MKSKNFYEIIYFLLLILISYIFINHDFRFGSYDVEPDYISGIFLIEKFGYPLYIYHPGTIHYYFLWLIYKITSWINLNIVSFILLTRSIYFFLGICLIYFSKIKKEIVLISIVFTLLITRSFYLGLISGETLIFFLSFVLLKYIERDKIKSSGILYGIMLNIKFTSILLLPFLFLKIFDSTKKRDTKKNISYFLITSVPLAFIHGLISFKEILYPIKITLLRVFNISQILYKTGFWFNLSNSEKLIFELLFYLFIIIILMITFYVLNKFKIFSKIFSDLNFKKYLSLLLLIIIILIGLFNFENIRLVLVLIPFIFFYLLENIKISSYKTLISSTFIILLFISKPINYSLKKVDQYIVETNSPILFYSPSGSWDSEINFLLWSKFEGLDSFNWPMRWINRYGPNNLNNIYFLNHENIECKNQILNIENLDRTSKINLNRKFTYRHCLSDILSKENLKIVVPKGFNNEFLKISENINKILNLQTDLSQEKEEFFIYKIIN